ncbi:MAG: conjugal transfer protein TraE, partial [Clostridia bacterium]
MSNNVKLNKNERKLIEIAIEKAKNKPKGVKSAQDTIPFERMFPDGVCRVTETFYTKTIAFMDINYQIAQNEDKTAIFEGWCDFLNYFDSSIKFQLSFVNSTANENDFENSINIEEQNDDFNSIRQEYSDMLKSQLERGNNGLVKTKYLTFGIDAKNIKIAKPRLERIENDLLNAFKKLGVRTHSLDGKERLKLMHNILRMDGNEPF